MNDIKKLFYDHVNSSLNDVLDNFKSELLDYPQLKYSVDSDEKIKFLKDYKDEVLPENVNPYLIKGVNYSNDNYILNETEIKELTDFYNVNLIDSKNGFFNNHNDNTKTPAWRSHSIVIMTLIYCLQLQIINEIINDLSNRNFITETGNMIFLVNNTINSEAFFQYLVNEWLRNEPNKITALKHITFKLWHRNTNQNKEVPYKIISTLKDFAVYWNNNDNMSNLIQLDINNPKLNEPDKTINQSYENTFMRYLNEFTRV